MSGSQRRWWRRTLTGYLEPLRQRFEGNRQRHEELRRELNQARFSVTYSDYLTQVAVTAVGGALFVALLTFVAVQASGLVLGRAVLGPVLTVALALALGALTGVLGWYVGYTRPGRVARRRARRLNVALPPTVSYMYALAHGGIDAVEVVRRTAQREQSYGEQAREMQLIVNEMEFGGQDFVTAVGNAADLTPCPATGDFLGDMAGVLETGGDFEGFLDEARREHLEELTGEQESYLEQLGLFAELYVTALVAGPLFVIVLLLVIGVLGAETIGSIYLLVYVGLPLGTAMALLVLDQLNSPFVSIRTEKKRPPKQEPPEDERAQAYAKRKRRFELRQRLSNPVERFVHSPTSSLLVSVPVALVVTGLVAATGVAQPTVAGFRARPLAATTVFGVLPFVLTCAPLAVFYELRQRYVERIRERFPDVLSSVARANRSGIGTAEAIRLEQQRADGVLEDELGQLYSDIRWFNHPSQAFRRLANRARIDTTRQTMALLAEANEASGNLQRTLSVAAQQARFRRQFAAERSREVASHVAVAVISFLVFLGIIVLLQQFYLVRVIEASAEAAATRPPGAPEAAVSLQNIDAAGFRLAFLHSVVIQGACIGFVAGKLSYGTVLAGVKYSIGMVLVTIVVFGVL
jgi:flagellar protein FlaJ